MFKRMLNTRSLTLGAMIAALYAALTLMLPVLSYGAGTGWECRISEALTILPLLFPEAIPGLTLGCLISNLLSPVGVPDIVFGTLATLLASVVTWQLREKPLLAILSPVVFNGLIVGTMLSVMYGLPLFYTMLQVAAGEIVAVAAGYLLYQMLLEAG
ncbi:MAG: QueT transporter family protein [Clostridia bacterium]|nr:QueT transporter family protein [Clostridia bacterium]